MKTLRAKQFTILLHNTPFEALPGLDYEVKVSLGKHSECFRFVKYEAATEFIDALIQEINDGKYSIGFAGYK